MKLEIGKHLPVLLCGGKGDGVMPDSQLVNSVYLDSPALELYHGRLSKTPGAVALRFRWRRAGRRASRRRRGIFEFGRRPAGPGSRRARRGDDAAAARGPSRKGRRGEPDVSFLSGQKGQARRDRRRYGTGEPELVFVERKTHRDSWTGDGSVKERFVVTPDEVLPLIRGEFDPRAPRAKPYAACASDILRTARIVEDGARLARGRRAGTRRTSSSSATRSRA